jgi:hypothetical protein
MRRKLRNCAVSRYHSNEFSSISMLHDVSYVVGHKRANEPSFVSVCRVCSVSVGNVYRKKWAVS